MIGSLPPLRPRWLSQAILAWMFAIFASSSANGAATYYVAPAVSGGSDSNPGTLAKPFLTVAKAIGIANSGDTITLKDGSYVGQTFTINKAVTLNSLSGKSKTFVTSAGITITASGAGTTSIQNITFSHSNKVAAITLDAASTVAFTGCDFIQNSAPTGASLILLGSNAMVTGCTFQTNTATMGNGGAIGVDASSTLVIKGGSVFSNNSATKGGAIDNFGTLSVDSSTFTSNLAQDAGALASEVGSHLVVTRSAFTGNQSFGRAGAIDSQCDAKIQWSQFVGNRALHGEGGAILAGLDRLGNSTTYPLTVQNSLFRQNSASGNGGAISQNGIGTLYFSTFSENSGNYGSAVCVNTTMILKDVIAWANSGAINTPDIYGGTSSYCDIGTTTPDPINHILSVDPQFSNPALGNLELKITSPCNGSGVPITSITDDLIHHSRSSLHPSMGAYEAGTYFAGLAEGAGPNGPWILWLKSDGSTYIDSYVGNTKTSILVSTNSTTPNWTPITLAIDSANIPYILWRTDTGNIEVWKLAPSGFDAKVARPTVAGPWTEQSIVAAAKGHTSLMLTNMLGYVALIDIDGAGNVGSPITYVSP